MRNGRFRCSFELCLRSNSSLYLTSTIHNKNRFFDAIAGLMQGFQFADNHKLTAQIPYDNPRSLICELHCTNILYQSLHPLSVIVKDMFPMSRQF